MVDFIKYRQVIYYINVISGRPSLRALVAIFDRFSSNLARKHLKKDLIAHKDSLTDSVCVCVCVLWQSVADAYGPVTIVKSHSGPNRSIHGERKV